MRGTSAAFSLQADVWPTLPTKGRQAVLGSWREDCAVGVLLELDELGCACLRLGDGTGRPFVLSSQRPMAAKRWYTIWGTFDAASGRATVGQRPWQPLFDGSDAGEASETTAHGAQIGLANVMTMAAWSDKNDSFGGHFNGKIHRPRVAKACLEGRDLAALGNFRVPDALRSRLLGAWDFALETPTDRIMDSGPMGLHGSANNIPVRAMKGPEWDGDVSSVVRQA